MGRPRGCVPAIATGPLGVWGISSRATGNDALWNIATLSQVALHLASVDYPKSRRTFSSLPSGLQ
jgi:hypothetical protein